MRGRMRSVDPQILLTFVMDDYLKSIGKVISQWSLMEAIMDQCIWQAAGIRNDYGRVITTQTQVSTKLDTLAALLWQRKAIIGEQFDDVSQYVRSCLLGRRNTIAHGYWDTQEDWPHALVVKFTARGRLTSQPGTWTVPDLELLALQIAEVTSWLMTLSQLLPKARARSGGLGHKSLDTPDLLRCAMSRKRALQPLTVSRRVLEARNPDKARSRQKQKAPESRK
jgi:hypothetical protein